MLHDFFNSLGPQAGNLLMVGGIVLAGVLLLSLLSRFVFGKKSTLTVAISSAISILFICCVTVLLRSAQVPFAKYLPAIPFVSFTAENMNLFSFTASDYTAICSQLVSMLILAFLVNLLDSWLTKGKNIFTWLFFRCLTVAGAMALHFVVTLLLNTFLPWGILTYAPVILLGVLILMLLTGALKLVVGAVLTTVNPLIAALYTFFFANIIGKQITRAVLTTGILAALLIGLESIGITAVSITDAAMAVYIPFLLLLIFVWYLSGRLVQK